jgi:hypothetical protein
MTFQEMLQELKGRLSSSGVSGFWSDTQLKRWLNLAQTRVAKKKSWPTLAESATVKNGTVIGQANYALPADYLYGTMLLIKVAGETYNYVPFIDFESGEFDLSKVFTIRGTQFFIKPTPIENGKKIHLWYQKRPTKLVNNGDISELEEDLHEVIILTALSVALKKERKYNLGNDALAEAEIIIRECWQMVKGKKKGPSKAKDITDFYPLYR